MLETVCPFFRRVYTKSKALYNCSTNTSPLLSVGSSPIVPSRTSMIVKRHFPPTLYAKGNNPRLRGRCFYYDLVEDTDIRPEPLVDIILSTYVKGVGNAGDYLSLKRSTAYNKFLIPGLAEYASSEMVDYARKIKADEKLQGKQIPISVEMCMGRLQKVKLSIVMNQFSEWTIEPWHIRASARKAGIYLASDDCIELPPKPITGPDMAKEGKHFFVSVIINNKFKVKVKCIIHHWTSNPLERSPFKPEFWLAPDEMLFPEDEKKETKDDSPPENPY